ncbi:hypothetical protein Drorol1_Dr00020857 [Drosera rotundifolia]
MACRCFRSSVFEPKRRTPSGVEGIEGHLLENIRTFSYSELKLATDDFHLSNKIGRGGFGIVYKGVLKGKVQVAVKALSAESRQGVREFLTEINMISAVRHPNLVGLVGCCVEGANRILVYEYLENRSLDRVLLSRSDDHVRLDWKMRSGICLGTARGLAYLHEEVFEWGGSQKLLLEWAWELYEEERLLELVDPELEDFPEEEVIRYIKVAFFCTQAASGRRPLMSQVVDMLSRNTRLNEKIITAPGFFPDSGDVSSKKMSAGSSQISSISLSITDIAPR